MSLPLTPSSRFNTKDAFSHPGHVKLLPVVVGLLGLLSQLLLHLGPAAKEDVVDEGVLQQREEDHDEAAHQVHVDGLDVGDLGERLPQVGVDGRHGEHRGDAWRGGGRTGFH